MEPTDNENLDLLFSVLNDDALPTDGGGYDPRTTDKRETPVFPTVAAQDDDEGEIFLNWPGKLPETETAEEEEEDDADGEDIGLFAARKKKKKKETGKTDARKDDRRYAFVLAAESDEEESGEAPRRKNADEDNENALNSVKYYKNAGKVRGLFLRQVLPIVLAAAFVIGFVFYYFRLRHLVFDNLSGYDAEEVFRESGIHENMFVFSVSADGIENRLRQKFPYIQKVRVERELPDTVHIVFSEDCARYYTKMYDEYFVISDSLRVLSRCKSEDELPAGLRQITFPPVSYAVVGYELRFFDESYLSFLTDFIEILADSAVYEKINRMDLSNRYYITLLYDDRLTFDIGASENLDTKLLYIKSLAEALEPNEHGTFTLIGNKMASFAAEKTTGSGQP